MFSIITLTIMTDGWLDIRTLLDKLDVLALKRETEEKRGIEFIQLGGIQLDYPLWWAAEHQYVGMITTILQLDKGLTTAGFNKAFVHATQRNNNNTTIIAMLHDARLNPGFNQSLALRWTAYHGCVDVFRVLLADERADPTVVHHDTLKDACNRGHAGILALLLKDKRIDPCYDNLRHMRVACEKGYVAIVDMLLANARVQAQLGEDELDVLIHATSSTNVKAVLEAYRQGKTKEKEREVPKNEKSKDAVVEAPMLVVDEAQDRAKDAIVEVETKPTATTVRLEVHVYVHQD